MNNFYFLADWKKNKQATWSGTCWGLYSALSKRTAVVDCDLNENSFFVFLHKVLRKLRLEQRDFNMSLVKRQRRKLKLLLGNKPCTVFQFEEKLFDTQQIKTFIYQDLSADYVKFMAENMPEVFAVSGFQTYNGDVLQKRAEVQDEYYRTCSGIFTMGKWMAADLTNRLHIPKNKVHHVGGGINLDEKLIDYSHKQGNKILFVGRDFVRKGGEITIKAFQKLREKRNDVELYVAGPAGNPLSQGMDGYHYMGDCSHERLSELFNLCDIFVMPSYFEAYGLVFIEALSYGLPCIGRNVYEMPYFIENEKTGLLLEKDDVAELADMMDGLLRDEQIKSNVRSKRDWYVNEYSWDSVAERILNVISNNEF